MNDQKQRTAPDASVCVTVFGDNFEEIEKAALDEAPAFFGPDARLELGHYTAREVWQGIPSEMESGKAFAADVTVRRLNDDDDDFCPSAGRCSGGKLHTYPNRWEANNNTCTRCGAVND